MKNRGKNKSVAFIILFNVYIYNLTFINTFLKQKLYVLIINPW